MLEVIGMHRKAAATLDSTATGPQLYSAAREAWDDALSLGNDHGFRNAQVTVLAPTGTIAFMMDCDTTGIEPDIALIKYKKLVGGGLLKIRQPDRAGGPAAPRVQPSRSGRSSPTSKRRRSSRALRACGTSTFRSSMRVQARQRSAQHPLTWATSR